MRRVGIYGGTFDPIHVGHLAIAEEAHHTLGLTQVYLTPAAQQPLKGQGHSASAAQRFEMVRRACLGNAALIPSDVELRRPPPSFTIDTLRSFRAWLDSSVELFFIIGADAARELPRWRSAAAIIALARLAIVGRPGAPLDIDALESQLPGIAARSTLISGPMLAISSSDLRARLRSGQPVRYQIPERALAYIRAQGLYMPAADGGLPGQV